MLRRTEFTLGETEQRLSLCFVNPGSGEGAVSRLSIEALPLSVVPELTIEWPTAGGRAPLRTSHPLIRRCCYWEFYTTEFAVPKGVVAGQAKVSVEFPLGATPIELTTREMVVPIVALVKYIRFSALRRALARFGLGNLLWQAGVGTAQHVAVSLGVSYSLTSG